MPYTYGVHRLVGVCLLAVAAVSAAAMTAVVALSGGDIGYAWRVIRHGQSSTDDVEWKRHVTIQAESPTPWTSRDRCGDVQQAAGGGFGASLLAGGATQLVVVRHGELICQWAAPGHRIDELRPVFSISKTVTALLLSRAVEAGKMSWEDPITHWIPELGERDRRFADITLADLVDMRSGIGFRVVARFPWFNEDAPRVYYASDVEAATLDDPAMASAPGTFTYNDWAPNLLGIAYRRATGHLMVGPDATQLWSSLGAQHPAQWLVDDHGFPWQERPRRQCSRHRAHRPAAARRPDQRLRPPERGRPGHPDRVPRPRRPSWLWQCPDGLRQRDVDPPRHGSTRLCRARLPR
jgi:CubicO group peptidase (beta-lactamase class C family)